MPSKNRLGVGFAIEEDYEKKSSFGASGDNFCVSGKKISETKSNLARHINNSSAASNANQVNITLMDSTEMSRQNLHNLKRFYKQIQRRRRTKAFVRWFQFVVVYILPPVGLVLSIIGILFGHFLKVNSFLIAGSLLLISMCGLIIQSCFWKRNLPNKFSPKEIVFNRQDGEDSRSISSEKNEKTESNNADTYKKISVDTLGSNNVRTSQSSMQRIRKMSTIAEGSNIEQMLNPEKLRRLSLALNRATVELTEARRLQKTPVNGVLNLTRRLTMATEYVPTYADYGYGWIGGQVPQGVRRGSAWNETGAGRFYASNYY